MKNKEIDNSITSGFLSDPIFDSIDRKFTCIEPLPGNGQTKLFKAKRFGRWYTLKSIAGEQGVATAGYGQLLKKEYETLMAIQHTGVVQALGMENVEGIGPCVIMEYIDGATLDEWLSKEPALKDRHRICKEIADAIEYIHSQGIVHRDIKPKNIMVTRIGEHVKIIDFGFADTDQHAQLKQPAGTYNYMSPEQMQTNIPDVRNDIYSFGMVMKEMNLGRAYKTIIRKCLLPLDQRWKSMNEVTDAIEKTERRRPWQAVAVASIILLAGALTLQTWRLQHTGNSASLVALDSMRTELDLQRQHSHNAMAALSQQMKDSKTSLGDSIQHLVSANEQLQEQLKKEEKLQQAALVALHKEMRHSGVEQHTDTLTRFEYRWKDLSLRIAAVGQFAHKYVDGLEDQCDRGCRDRIRESMLNEWQSWSNEISQRIILLLPKDVRNDTILRHNLPPDIKL